MEIKEVDHRIEAQGSIDACAPPKMSASAATSTLGSVLAQREINRCKR
jgi:hypothetical protein